MNQINLVGRMTRDAEDVGSPPVGVRFSIATEDYDFGTKKRETEFHDCVAFGKVAEVIKNYAGKGREVRVTGKIRTREYTPQSGPNQGVLQRTKNVVVDDFELLAGQPAGGPSQGQFQGSTGAETEIGGSRNGW